MSQIFSKSGIRFQYPVNWTLEAEDSESGWTASVLSPETAFMMVSFYAGEADPAELADEALKAMQSNYSDLESEQIVETLAGQPTVGYDVDFFALDLTNTCWIRSFAVDIGCILMMGQCTDEELSGNGMILRAILASIAIEDEG